MTQTKIRGKFYPLQHAEWLRACQELTPSQRDVLYYIRTLDPYGNGIAINTAEIARTLSNNGQIVHRQTVSRALKELDRKGFIDLEVIQVNVRVQPKGFWYCQAVDEADNQQAEVIDSQQGEVVDCQQGEVIETPGCVETPDWIATHPDGSPDTHGTPPLSPPAWISAPPIKTNKTLSEGEEGKEKVKEPELGDEASERLSSQPETFNPSFLVEPKDPVEDKFSAAPRYKTLQQRVWDWLPDGPWKMSDGKLDPQFRDFVANDWLSRWGGDIHQRRADVLAHFKKDPANLPIRWEQYASEYRHRYENTKLLLDNGMSIKEDYQQRLIDNHRAIAEPLPPELDPVARQQTAISPSTTALSPSKKALGRESQQLALPLPDLSPEGAGLGDAPCQENAAAYRVFQPEPIEDPNREAAAKPPAPAQFEELKRSRRDPLRGALSQLFSMPNGNRAEAVQPPKSEIEELNLWLADPVLRKEVMPRVMKSGAFGAAGAGRYTVEFDEEGVPFRVVEVKDRDDLSEE